MSHTFSSFFPTPAFLAMHYAGIEVADTAVRFVDFREVGKQKRVRAYDEVPLKNNVVQKGVIQDMTKVTEALRALKEKYNLEHVQSVIPEEKAYLYTTQLKLSTDINVQDSIEFTIEENVPLSVNEVVFSYDFLGNNPKKNVQAVVSVVPQEVVGSYNQVLVDAGLVPVGFKVESHAIARSVISKKDTCCTCIIVDLSDSKTGLYIIHRGTVFYSSSTPTESILTSAKDLSGNLLEKDSQELKSSGLSSAFIENEIKRLQDYWKSQKDTLSDEYKEISHVVVCGERAEDTDIITALSRSLKLPIMPANVWSNAFDIDEYIPPIHAQDAMRYASAIGVAL